MSVDEIIKELESLPTIVYCGYYHRRITCHLRDAIIALLKEQRAKIADLEKKTMLIDYDANSKIAIAEKLEHGLMVCEATKTTIVHLDKGDAEKVLELLKEQEKWNDVNPHQQ